MFDPSIFVVLAFAWYLLRSARIWRDVAFAPLALQMNLAFGAIVLLYGATSLYQVKTSPRLTVSGTMIEHQPQKGGGSYIRIMTQAGASQWFYLYPDSDIHWACPVQLEYVSYSGLITNLSNYGLQRTCDDGTWKAVALIGVGFLMLLVSCLRPPGLRDEPCERK